MPLLIRQTTQFRKDIKRLRRQGAALNLLESVVIALASQETLEAQYRDHLLTGNWRGFRECHIQPDWLLIYRIKGETVQLARKGSHTELFR